MILKNLGQINEEFIKSVNDGACQSIVEPDRSGQALIFCSRAL
jgi:hypothetical protein